MVTVKVKVTDGVAKIDLPDWDGKEIYLRATLSAPKTNKQLALIHPWIQWFADKQREIYGNDWSLSEAKEMSKKWCNFYELRPVRGPKGLKMVRYYKSMADYTKDEAIEFIERFKVLLFSTFNELPPIEDEQ